MISSRLRKLSGSNTHNPDPPSSPISPQITPLTQLPNNSSTQSPLPEPQQLPPTLPMSQVEPEPIYEGQESTSSAIGDGEDDAPNMDAPRQIPPQANRFEPATGTFQPPPSIDEARMARDDLNNILRPR